MIIHTNKLNHRKEIVFKTKSVFISLTYYEEGDLWSFGFENDITIQAQTFWRFLKNKEIRRTSFDHMQKFGLPAPINLEETLNKELAGKSLLEVKIQKNTGDLLLTLTDNLQIEIFISSSGYESYDFYIKNKRYIGLGHGEIGIVDN